MLPFTDEAFTGPAIPLIDRLPLISLIFSRFAQRGAMIR
jgi:hypothetical protein